MAILKILIYGNATLRQVCEPLKNFTKEDADFVRSVGETMYASRGVGLAAPQVGVMKRIIALDVDQLQKTSDGKPKRRLQVFINPEVRWESDDDASMTEGCLSVPGAEAEVFRPARVRVVYRDEEFEPREIEAEGLLARVLQHEIDHLNGILFVDRVSRLKRVMLAGQLNRLRKESQREIESTGTAPRL
jgi:peptide deformylase